MHEPAKVANKKRLTKKQPTNKPSSNLVQNGTIGSDSKALEQSSSVGPSVTSATIVKTSGLLAEVQNGSEGKAETL